MKNNKLKLYIYLALLAAISIIMGKYLAIRGGDVMRFSLENTPIILAGIAFGPWAGAAVGIIADLVGCLMVAYTINPLVTLGAAAIGVVSGLLPRVMKSVELRPTVKIGITVAASHLLGSVIIKTVGLSAYYDMPFIILMLWRALNYLIVGIIDGVIVHVLLKNPQIRLQIQEIGK